MADLLVNDVTPRAQYIASAGQTIFPYNFAIFEDADLKVYLTPNGATPDDATDILTLTTDYTVDGEATTSGGDVTLVSPASAGDTITIVRDVPVARTSDYQTLGDFLAETVNDDMDKFVMMVQQQENALAGRLLKFLETANLTGVDTKLPAPAADEVLKWNSTGDGLVGVKITDLDPTVSAVTAFVLTLLDDPDADTFWNTLTAAMGDKANARSDLGAPGLVDANVFTNTNTFTKLQKWAKGADVASASALALGDDGNYFDITGSVTINSINTKGIGTVVMLQFDASPVLTHHATNFILPGAANITAAPGDKAIFVEWATGDWECVSYQKADGTPLYENKQSDDIIQEVITTDGEVATGTTVIPFDDTIPQNTEGDEYMTVTITPTDAANKLIIEAAAAMACSGSGSTQKMALFQDAIANALACSVKRQATTNTMDRLALRYEMVAGTTSAITFKIRAGGSSGTLTFNGSSLARRFGGVLDSFIRVREIKA
jgi:hypothetical protein